MATVRNFAGLSSAKVEDDLTLSFIRGNKDDIMQRDSIDDRVNDLNIKNIYIGNGALMQYFFLTVKGDNMFLTLTDLDNTVVKKNKFIKNYIYFFHGAVTHKSRDQHKQ